MKCVASIPTLKIQKLIVYSVARRYSSVETEAEWRPKPESIFVAPPYGQCNVVRRAFTLLFRMCSPLISPFPNK